MLENGQEIESTESILEEVWLTRGTNNKLAEKVRLPNKMKSGYGFPTFLSLKESTLHLDRFDNYFGEGNERIRIFCFGLFEDRTIVNKNTNIKPIGYLFLQEVGGNKPHIECSDNWLLSMITHVTNPDGTNGIDPLFSIIEDDYHNSPHSRKIPLAAIRVGSDTTYRESRNKTIAKLEKNGTAKLIEMLEEMKNNPRNINGGGNNERLEEFQHTHLGFGKLMLSGAIDVCRRIGYEKLYIKGANENSQKLVAKSSFPYVKSRDGGFTTLIIDTKK